MAAAWQLELRPDAAGGETLVLAKTLEEQPDAIYRGKRPKN